MLDTFIVFYMDAIHSWTKHTVLTIYIHTHNNMQYI